MRASPGAQTPGLTIEPLAGRHIADDILRRLLRRLCFFGINLINRAMLLPSLSSHRPAAGRQCQHVAQAQMKFPTAYGFALAII